MNTSKMPFVAEEPGVNTIVYSPVALLRTTLRTLAAEIADSLNLGGNTDQEKLERLINKIDELKERVGFKKTIKDYGISEEDFLSTLDEMSEKAFDDQCTGANPRYPLISEIKEIYLKTYYGGEI